MLLLILITNSRIRVETGSKGIGNTEVGTINMQPITVGIQVSNRCHCTVKTSAIAESCPSAGALDLKPAIVNDPYLLTIYRNGKSVVCIKD